MNIFPLDENLEKSAQSHVDKHIVKLITEANQLLASAYPKGVAPYRITHVNHPWSKFARENKVNFNYILNYCFALCKEYTFRYGKVHKGEGIATWYKNNPPNLSEGSLTELPRCFGAFKDSIRITNSAVYDYRNYYKMGKSHLFSWRGRQKPDWI